MVCAERNGAGRQKINAASAVATCGVVLPGLAAGRGWWLFACAFEPKNALFTNRPTVPAVVVTQSAILRIASRTAWIAPRNNVEQSGG